MVSTSTTPVAVLGAGGGTGNQCINRLVEQGIPAVAVVREPAKYNFPSGVKVVRGDVTDKSSLASALAGVQGVIFAAAGKGYWSPDSVDHQGVANVIEVARGVGVQHVVLVSSMLVHTRNRWHPVRLLLNNIRYGLMDAKFKGEEALRRSGLAYTVVRPGGLNNDAGGKAMLRCGLGEAPQGIPQGSISRADVAAVCVAALQQPAAQGLTVEVVSDPKSPVDPPAWSRQLTDMWPVLNEHALAPQ